MVGSRSSRGGELLERLGRVRVGAQAAGHEHPEPWLQGAVRERAGDGDHADVVEHGLAAVGGAAREVDLELAGQALGVRMVQEVAEGGFGPGADVQDLVGAGPGQVAAHDVADGVPAGLPGGQAHARQLPEQLGNALQLHEVELDVETGGQMSPTPAVAVGHAGQQLQLLGGHASIRELDADHLVVATLPLAVDTVVETEHPEGVLVHLARQVVCQQPLELLDVGRGLRSNDAGLHEVQSTKHD